MTQKQTKEWQPPRDDELYMINMGSLDELIKRLPFMRQLLEVKRDQGYQMVSHTPLIVSLELEEDE